MAHRKHAFRFKIPWLSGAHESLSPRPKDISKSATQSDTSVPIQRPSVINSADSPPKRAEPPNKSPTQLASSSVVIETTLSKPPSPSTSPNLTNSSPSSLQHASQIHVELSQPQSPSHHDKVSKPSAEESIPHALFSATEQEKEKVVNKFEPMKPPETSFQPEIRSTQATKFEQQASPKPSLSPVSKTEPDSQLHPSSSLALKQTNEVLKANHGETNLNASSTSQEEKEEMAVTVSKSPQQEAESKMKSPLKIISKSSKASSDEKEKMAVAVSEPVKQEAEPKMKSPFKIITKSPKTSSQPTKTTLDEDKLTSRKQKASLESQSKLLQHEEKEKVMKKVGKTSLESQSKFLQHEDKDKVAKVVKAKDTNTKASTSGTKDKKQHGIRETVERKIMFATSNSSGKDIGVMNSADQRIKNVSSSNISPQRTTPANEESEKEKTPMQTGIKNDITKFVHKISASVNPTQPMEDKQFSVITLAGDNRGATMHVGSESVNKEGSIHIHRDYKTDSEKSIEVTTDGEGNTNAEEDSMEHGEVGKAYVNSNIQSINNSLMFHGSITERDPGVQVTMPKKPLEVNKPCDTDTQNHRTEFNLSRVQKSTYQPIVRRRCLRGHLHEPNDSDPNKPSSHGCKFSCGKNNDDIEIM